MSDSDTRATARGREGRRRKGGGGTDTTRCPCHSQEHFTDARLCTCPSMHFKALAGSTSHNVPCCQTLWSVFCVHVSWSSHAFEMAASGAPARQALVNEPSGAHFSSGDFVEIGHCAHDHGVQLKLGRESDEGR